MENGDEKGKVSKGSGKNMDRKRVAIKKKE